MREKASEKVRKSCSECRGSHFRRGHIYLATPMRSADEAAASTPSASGNSVDSCARRAWLVEEPSINIITSRGTRVLGADAAPPGTTAVTESATHVHEQVRGQATLRQSPLPRNPQQLQPQVHLPTHTHTHIAPALGPNLPPPPTRKRTRQRCTGCHRHPHDWSGHYGAGHRGGTRDGGGDGTVLNRQHQLRRGAQHGATCGPLQHQYPGLAPCKGRMMGEGRGETGMHEPKYTARHARA